ncbi:MAG TPA: glycosyltransferase family A protein [Gemmatimonadales bacterium]|nr:glycosyltransferase family A protein [Gemmatimonadales bacterium]
MISVIIPAYNASRYLAEAIGSVRAQVDVAVEIIVVDDGSTDDTAAVARAAGDDIRIVTKSNGGAATARNAGVAASQADLVAFLDADDLWPEGQLARLAHLLAGEPSILMAIGRTQLVGKDGVKGSGSGLVPVGSPWHAPVFGSGLFRRQIFTVVGPMDPSLQPAEDLDWFIRARERAVPTLVVDEVTLLYRWHGENLTSGADPIRRRMLVALKRSLDRRRQAGGGPASRVRGLQWLPTADAVSPQ